MTRVRQRALAVLGCAALFLGAGTAMSNAAAKASSANGQGTLDGGARHFAFNAKQNSDGTVTGQAELTNKLFTGANGVSPYQLHIDISCMKTIGNTAFFGGTVKRTNDPSLVDAVYFSVQDNGEPGKGVDMISRVFFFDEDDTTQGDPQLCQLNQIDDFPMDPIEGGNIQVRPAS